MCVCWFPPTLKLQQKMTPTVHISFLLNNQSCSQKTFYLSLAHIHAQRERQRLRVQVDDKRVTWSIHANSGSSWFKLVSLSCLCRTSNRKSKNAKSKEYVPKKQRKTATPTISHNTAMNKRKHKCICQRVRQSVIRILLSLTRWRKWVLGWSTYLQWTNLFLLKLSNKSKRTQFLINRNFESIDINHIV